MVQEESLKGLRKFQKHFNSVNNLGNGNVPKMQALVEKVEKDCQRLLEWKDGSNEVKQLPGHFFPQYRQVPSNSLRKLRKTCLEVRLVVARTRLNDL